MNNQEFLSEERYQKNNKKVKWAGITLILIGISLILIGIFVIKVPDMGEDGWFESSTARMMTIFPGGFLVIVGLMVRFIIANQRNIMAYQIQQTMPIVQEGAEQIAPTVANMGKSIVKEMAPVYGAVSKEISKGIKDGLKDEE